VGDVPQTTFRIFRQSPSIFYDTCGYSLDLPHVNGQHGSDFALFFWETNELGGGDI
jgi:hypothetical protein